MNLSTSSTESCDDDDDDDDDVSVGVVEELADKPGTTNATLFDILQYPLAFFGEMWFLTAGPVVSIPMILAELPEKKNCGSWFKKHNRHE